MKAKKDKKTGKLKFKVKCLTDKKSIKEDKLNETDEIKK